MQKTQNVIIYLFTKIMADLIGTSIISINKSSDTEKNYSDENLDSKLVIIEECYRITIIFPQDLKNIYN